MASDNSLHSNGVQLLAVHKHDNIIRPATIAPQTLLARMLGVEILRRGFTKVWKGRESGLTEVELGVPHDDQLVEVLPPMAEFRTQA